MRRGAARRLACAAAFAGAAAAAAAAQWGGAPAAAPGTGAGSAAAPELHVRAELRAGADAVPPGGSVELALVLDHSEGWHSYWINPGDAGLPTRIEWSLPPGFSVDEPRWPPPSRIVDRTAVSYGYAGRIAALATLRAPPGAAPGSVVELGARASLLACEELCVPEAPSAVLRLRVGRAEVGGGDPFVAAAASLLPNRLAEGGATIGPDGSASLRFSGLGGLGGAELSYFFPETAGAFSASAGQEPRMDGPDLVLRLAPVEGGEAAAPPERLKGLLRAGAGGEWLLVDFPAVRGGAAARPGAGGILAAVVLALVGGLLLNLMPCVLPVLSLKVMSLIKGAGQSRRRSALMGLAYAGGVVASFLALLAVVLALQARGLEAGWGFQFRSPFALGAMALLFFLAALSMLGAVEVGVSLAAAAGAASGKGGYLGSFLSGVLSTAAATPCTAPFMGAAIGTALASGGAGAAAIFASLGIGMALPYALLSAFPGALRRLPKAGRWTETLKQALAFPLLATALWLAYLLEGAGGGGALLSLLAAALAASLAAWVRGRFGQPGAGRGARIASGVAALALLAAAVALLPRGAPSQGGRPAARTTEASATPGAAIEWVPYDAAALGAALAAGETVFLDFTADWCLTCKANDLVAFGDRRVVRAFSESGILAMKADWTLPDPAIARAVAGYGRSGIPLYVVHRGSAPPELLPEILTPGILIDALATPGGPP